AMVKLPLKSNPGKHVVHASAAGYADATKDVTLREAETQTVMLTLVANPSQSATVATTGPLTTPETPTADTGTNKNSPTLHVGFGAGAAGLAVGTVAGLIHLSKVSKVKQDYCGGGTDCQPGFEEARDAAKPSATISTVGFIVGGAGVAAGVVGLLMPSR